MYNHQVVGLLTQWTYMYYTSDHISMRWRHLLVQIHTCYSTIFTRRRPVLFSHCIGSWIQNYQYWKISVFRKCGSTKIIKIQFPDYVSPTNQITIERLSPHNYILRSQFDIYLCLRISYKLFINPLTAKLFNLNFHPLEVVSRWRDPKLQVS